MTKKTPQKEPPVAKAVAAQDAPSTKHILHWSPRSPFVKKIVVAAHELGLDDHFEQVRSVVPTDDHDHPIFADNPLGRIPAVVTPEGDKINGSTVIMEYLDVLAATANGAKTPQIFPADPATRLKVRNIENLCDGMLETLLNWMLEWYFPTYRIQTNLGNNGNKINRSLDVLEQELDWIASSGINAASITTGCTLSYLDFRFTRIIDWRANRPKLAKWHESFIARPSYQENRFREG